MSNQTTILRRIPVLLPLPLAGVLDYLLPDGMEAVPGDIVIVPLNGRERIGVVWDGEPGAAFPAHRLKPVIEVKPGVRFARPLRQFIDWVSAYTLSALGDVLAMALRSNAVDPDKSVLGLQAAPLSNTAARVLGPARQRVLAALENGPLSAANLLAVAGVSAGVVRAMLKAGILERVALEKAPSAIITLPPRGSPLSDDQLAPAAVVEALAAVRGYSVTLLQGATGSGKTEVYFEAVRACVAIGRQVLILLPEIALSAQWLKRYEQRFGMPPALWHSDLGSRARRTTWRSVAAGNAQVVVGARSALFLPFPDLGLIIVDEEHDAAFKQEDGVIYHARDMAVVRGRLCEATVLLVSATPSLETLANVEAGRYARLDLPQRYGGASLPTVIPVDLRAHPPARGSFLSPTLIDEIAGTLAKGEQTLLFLNRRGYAPLTLCRACGHRVECPNCTAWLVEHRLRRILTCHHCGHTLPIPTHCPSCGVENSLAPVGPGVERIAEEAERHFPEARRLVMASDTLPGPHAATEAAGKIERREVDLVIGTQIAAKGWHFPHLTLVGVVDADLGLGGGDLRAAERTMQLLHQVAGRAGRAKAAGKVMLQTYQSEHPVIRALTEGDFDLFMKEEAAQRRPGHWPPFGRLAAVIVSADSAEQADTVAQALGRAAPTGEGVIVLGPAPAPLSVLRGRHRRRLLLRTTKDIAVQPILRKWLGKLRTPRSVRIDIDVDPISFL